MHFQTIFVQSSEYEMYFCCGMYFQRTILASIAGVPNSCPGMAKKSGYATGL